MTFTDKNHKRALTTVLATFIAGTALAQDAHDHSGAAGRPAQQQESVSGAPGTKGMAEMQEHMKLMREQMQKIVAATDRAERQRLLDEHMKSMRESMARMGGSAHGGEGGPGKMDCMEMMQKMHAGPPAAPK